MPNQPNQKNQPTKLNTSCIILAGGKGKRFNHQDKGLIKLNNKPLIEHVIEAIKPQINDIVISANRNSDTYSQYGHRVISDKTNDFRGPLSGVSACIPACQHEWILVLPCDIPKLPNNLVEKLSKIDCKMLIVAKAHSRRQLVFLMHASLTDNLNQYLQQGHQKAMTWIDLQCPQVVEFDIAGNDFLNINTQDKLETL